MRSHTRLFVAILAILLAVGAASAQSTGSGDLIAGQASPWRNAHFVILAYGAIWGILVLYLLRLRGMVKALAEEVKSIRKTIEHD